MNPRAPIAERLATATEMDGDCLVFIGTRINGYGRMIRRGKAVLAHRVAWELAHGPIPRGLCVLHRCDNPPCVRVDHLFLGTRADNNRDRQIKGRSWHPNRPIECPRGHAYTPENTYTDARGCHSCRTCMRAKRSAYVLTPEQVERKRLLDAARWRRDRVDPARRERIYARNRERYHENKVR